MVIGGHAADAEIMAGALVLKHRQAGWEPVFVHATPGEKGHPRLSAAAYLEQKKQEAQAAAEAFGGIQVMLPWGDGELPVSEEAQWAIADAIRQYRPEVIVTHWRGSIHRDHRNTHDNVMEALFYAALPAFERAHPAHRARAVYFAENWEDPNGFEPSVYVDVTSVWPDYLECVKAYELFRGGISTFPYTRYYDALGTLRGCLSGYEKAVALMTPPGPGRRKVELA